MIHFTLGATMIREASVPRNWQLKLSTYLLACFAWILLVDALGFQNAPVNIAFSCYSIRSLRKLLVHFKFLIIILGFCYQRRHFVFSTQLVCGD